jgi:hypothetical protein
MSAIATDNRVCYKDFDEYDYDNHSLDGGSSVQKGGGGGGGGNYLSLQRVYYPSNNSDSYIRNASTGVLYPFKVGSQSSRQLFKYVDTTGVYDSTGKKVRPQRRCSPKEHFVKQTYPIPYANHLYYDSPEECARHFNTKQHVSINLNPELVKSWHEMKKEFANANPNTSDE